MSNKAKSIYRNFDDLEAIKIGEIYQRFPKFKDRIDYYSKIFLGRPYLSGAQGEGLSGKYDQSPLYRFDVFDCVTYVNNVLALSLAKNEDEFLSYLLKLNYYDSLPLFENRFHFMSCDWNIENQNNGFVTDITQTFLDKQNKKISVSAEGVINKPGWYDKQNKRVPNKIKAVDAAVDYLPLFLLFDSNNKIDKHMLAQIPQIAIVEIVRPNWQLQDKIGTNLHVSHLGFAVKKNDVGEIYFRHASSQQGVVVEVELSDYLSQYINSETIKGINIQEINNTSDLFDF